MKTHLPPVQYYVLHPIGRALVEECLKRYGNTPTHRQIAIVVENVIRQRYPHAFTPNSMLDRETVIDIMTDSQIGRDYLDWWSAGSHIFLFSDALVRNVLSRNVDAMPTSLLTPEFRVFYLKFGQRTAIETVPGKLRYLDGAYVSQYRGGLAVTCTQCSEDGTTGGCGTSFFVDLGACATVGEALALGLKEQEADLAEGGGPESGTARDFRRDTKAQRRAVFEHGLPIAREATKLIANGLAFVRSEKELISEDWLGAPVAMLKKLERSLTPKEHQRNLSKLWHQGFAKVYFCSTGGFRGATFNTCAPGSETNPLVKPGDWFVIGQILQGPFWFDDPHSGTPCATKFGVNVGVQALAVIDIANQRQLHARPVQKTPSPFTASEVLEFIGEVLQKHGHPKKGILISKSVWQSSNEMLMEDGIEERARILEQLDIQIDPMAQKDKDEIAVRLTQLRLQVLFDEANLP